MKKLGIAIIVLLALLAISCAKGSGGSSKVTIAAAGNFYVETKDPKLLEGRNRIDALTAAYTTKTKKQVEWIKDTSGGQEGAYYSWLKSKILAGEAPNIAWTQYYQRNKEAGNAWLALDKYLDMPNPYIEKGKPGNDKWRDLFNEDVLRTITAPDGKLYQINLDWVETAFFVNTEMLKNAGVDYHWKTWAEMLAAGKALRAKGIEPLSVNTWAVYQWLDDVLLSAAFSKDIPSWQLGTKTDWRMLTQEELAKAIFEKKFTTADPRFKWYVDRMSEFIDAMALKGFEQNTEWQKYQDIFMQKKAAMIWIPPAIVVGLADNNIKMDLDSTYLPGFTAAEFPQGVAPMNYRVGGPSSTLQWGIPKSILEKGGEEAVKNTVDFMMYFSAPQNFNTMQLETRGLIPVLKGANEPPFLASIKPIIALPERGITDPQSRLDAKYATAHINLMQQYFGKQISFTELQSKYQKNLDDAVKRLAESEKYTWYK